MVANSAHSATTAAAHASCCRRRSVTRRASWHIREAQDAAGNTARRPSARMRARRLRSIVGHDPGRRMLKRARALVRTIRPRQWVKNVFVGAPLVFSRELSSLPAVSRAVLAVLAFCALSGAVYAFNDVLDVEADRRHPSKCRRPIAAGDLSERGAVIWSVVLAAGALAGSLALRWQFAA